MRIVIASYSAVQGPAKPADIDAASVTALNANIIEQRRRLHRHAIAA
jgi:hypothetical protein